MRKTIFLLVGLMISVVFADNLVQNSDFMVPAGKSALFWTVLNAARNGMSYVRAEGKSYYQFSSETPATPCVRQYGMGLVAGEKYRISFDVSSEGLTYSKLWCVVASYGWKKDAGIKFEDGELKTDGIQHFESEIVAPDSLENNYSIAFYLKDATGKCRLYNMALEPLSEKARLESHGNAAIVHPYMGILALNRMSIPQEQNQVTIAVSWVKGAPVVLQAEIDGKSLPEQSFKDGYASLDVSAYKAGTHRLHLKAVQNGKTLVEREEDFAFAEPLPAFHHTRRALRKSC